MDARARIVAGVAGLLIAAAVAPSIVGALLMLFSLLVLIFAVIGAVWPSVLKLPNRLASVWVFTLAVGLFLGGGMLISPPNGHGTASDAPASEQIRRPIESPARDRHIREMEQAAEARRRMAARRSGPSGPDPETDPCGYVDQNYNRMSPAERNRMLQACGNVVRGSGRSGQEVEAAEYLHGVAGCLQITRPRLLGVFTHPTPELLVNTIARSCMEDPDLSSNALALAERAVARIDDFLDLAHVDNEEQFDFVLGNIIAAYEREADRLNER